MTTFTVDAGGTGNFLTIQEAIDAASNGDTIVVSAGTYDEDLQINKAVAIQGAQAGVSGTDAGRDAASGVGETTIIGRSDITASGVVTIDGVRFLNDASTTGGGFADPTLQVASAHDHVITNSIFYSAVNGGADGVLDTAIHVLPLATGAVDISDNYFSGAFDEAFSGASWGRGIFFDGAGIGITIDGNTFEFTRTGINLDMTPNSIASVLGNTFITNGSGTTVNFDFDHVIFADNNFENTSEEFNFSNVTTDIDFDAEIAVATVGPPVIEAVVVRGGSGNDTIRGTAGTDLLDGNASGISVADNNILQGRGGNDVLLGRDGDDVLDGGEGNDLIVGGLGDDSFIYRPGSEQDRITGFIAGLNTDDHIDVSAFSSFTSFAQVLALATQVGQNTVIDFGGGDVLTLANVLKGDLVEEDFILNSVDNDAPRNDFNGDGTSDMLWQSHGPGALGVWLMQNGFIQQTIAINHDKPGWGGITGDFDGDGTSDVLWQSDGSGELETWLMQDGQIQQTIAINHVMPGWTPSSGDFNGDGTDDLLWNNGAGGVLGVWQVQNGAVTSAAALNHDMPGWNSVIGDFNGDGTDDLLWNNGAQGVLGVWVMHDGTVGQTTALNHDMPGWSAIAGDFNGDGTDDLLWNNGAQGVLGVWVMHDGIIGQTIALNHDMPGWTATAGDFNGDGTDDLLWNNGAQGVLGVWIMQDGIVAQTIALNHDMLGWDIVT